MTRTFKPKAKLSRQEWFEQTKRRYESWCRMLNGSFVSPWCVCTACGDTVDAHTEEGHCLFGGGRFDSPESWIPDET